MSARAPTWAAAAVLYTHVMAPWWNRPGHRLARRCLRHDGNVTFLPKPIAGYRIRHDRAGVVVEIKPRSAAALVVGRCENRAEALALLAAVSSRDGRPFLGEIGRAA